MAEVDATPELTAVRQPPDIHELTRRYEAEKQRTARLALVARLGQRMAARLEPEGLFATTVAELHQKLGYDHVSLFLLKADDPTVLVQRASASRWSVGGPVGGPVGYEQAVSEGILGAAARQQQPQFINNIHSDGRYIPIPYSENLQAEIAVPILLGSRLLGVLDVAGVDQFDQEDVAALQVVADQLAVAIGNAEMFSHTQRVLAETQLLYETSERISTAMNVTAVIEAYLIQVATRGRYACTVVLYEFDENGQRQAVVVRGRWSPEEGFSLANVRLPYSQDALDLLLDSGQTVAINDVHTDPRVSASLRQIQKESGRPALALIPLIARRRRIGLVVLSYTAVYQWRPEDLRPYQATAVQLASAIDSRRQQRLLQDRSRQIAVLEERQRLARELHDSVTQLIFSMTLIAQSIAPAWRRDPDEGEKRVQRLLALSQSALAEMRALLTELRPSAGRSPLPAATGLQRLEREDLLAAVGHYAAEIGGSKLRLVINPQSFRERLPLSLAEPLYRIAQEALNNVVKHAQAQQVTITLQREKTAVRLTICDNGCGFVVERAAELPGHMGLATMHERIEAAGGTLQINSEPGQGTAVVATIPWSEAM
jgi:signal transduction histidine kinase